MATLSETDVTSQAIGRTICSEHLARCARKNRTTKDGIEYIVYSCGFLYDQELRELFGVTDKLKDLWERRGTEFDLYFYIEGDRIVSCQINKFREGDGARPSYSSLKCTQQELRIAQRILDYLC